MSRLGILIVAATLAASACSKTKSKDEAATKATPAAPRVAAIITKSKELRDRACACQDASCAASVRADHDAWLKAQIDEYGKQGVPPSTKAQEAEAAKWQRELFECLDKPHAEAPPATGAPTMTPPTMTPPTATPSAPATP